MRKLTLSQVYKLVNTRTKYERISLLIVLCFIVLVSWKFLIMDTLSNSNKIDKDGIFSEKTKAEKLEEEKIHLVAELSKIKVGDYSQHALDMKNKLLEIEKQINVDRVLVASKKDLAEIFKNLNKITKNVNLEKIEKLDMQELKSKALSTDKKVKRKLYAQPIEISFTSNYEEATKFFRELESIGWSFLYKDFNYKVIEELLEKESKEENSSQDSVNVLEVYSALADVASSNNEHPIASVNFTVKFITDNR